MAINSPPERTEELVERACDALLEALRPHIAAKYPDAVDMDITWAGATEEARAIFIPAMHAALEAGCAGLVAENARLREALRPFADCVEQIKATESDDEWAKFRLLIKDYRRAAKAVGLTLPGFARCATCGGEFDEGEWNASSECPECETPSWDEDTDDA
jgi:predicted Zn-ribbon and HTH transcriptional regulator